MRVGAFGHCAGGELVWSIYVETGETALQVLAEPARAHLGPVEAMITTCPIDHGAPAAGEHEIWVRLWGENDGVGAALIRDGIGHPTGLFCRCGDHDAVAALYTLTPEAEADLRAAFDANPDMRVAAEQARAKRRASDGN